MANSYFTLSMEIWGTILCMTFSFFIYLGNHNQSQRAKYLILMVMESMILLFSDAAAVYFRGNESMLGYYMVRISNYLCFFNVCAVEYTAGRYWNHLLISEGQKPIRATRYLVEIPSIINVIYITVSQFTKTMYYFDEHNRYHRAGGVVVFAVISLLVIVALICIIAKNAKKVAFIQSMPLLFVFVMVLIADIIQWLFYGTSLVYLTLAVCITILFLAYEREEALLYTERKTKLLENELKIARQEAALAESESELAKMNLQLSEKRNQLMLSQIRPHFLYNTLAAISFLCISDPKKAKETTDYFATYLRKNLESISNDKMVPFEQELEYTKAYLYIEQTRFGDDLQVECDIQYSNFMMPTLSLQPIVENAVRHGIFGREDGGKITIQTLKNDKNIQIIVKDTGIGFDVNQKMDDGREHIGVNNVRERLGIFCGGNLTIDSTPEVGTTVTYTIPEN